MSTAQRSIAISMFALLFGGVIGFQLGVTGDQQGATRVTPSGSAMSDMVADMNAQLVGKTGDAFDKAFLASMIVHHQGAVEMARLALINARHEEVKSLATAIIVAQQKEIEEMREWQQAWFGIDDHASTSIEH